MQVGLKFTKVSGYYGRPVYEFNLPAGHSCPFAKQCKSRADRITGKVSYDQKVRTYRCYAASSERFPAVRESRWNNYDLLRRVPDDKLAIEISAALPLSATHVRIHGSGARIRIAYRHRRHACHDRLAVVRTR